MGFRRYGGDLVTSRLGAERFADIRMLSVVVGLPFCLVAAMLNPKVGLIMLVSSISHFLLGFLGELSIKLGYYLVVWVGVCSTVVAIWFSKPYFISLAIFTGFNVLLFWNARFLYLRNKH